MMKFVMTDTCNVNKTNIYNVMSLEKITEMIEMVDLYGTR